MNFDKALDHVWEVQQNEYGVYLIGAFMETLIMDGSMEKLFVVLATTQIEGVAYAITDDHNECLSAHTR